MPARRNAYIRPRATSSVAELDDVAAARVELAEDRLQPSRGVVEARRQLEQQAPHVRPEQVGDEAEVTNQALRALEAPGVCDQLVDLDGVDERPVVALPEPGLDGRQRRPGVERRVQLDGAEALRVVLEPCARDGVPAGRSRPASANSTIRSSRRFGPTTLWPGEGPARASKARRARCIASARKTFCSRCLARRSSRRARRSSGEARRGPVSVHGNASLVSARGSWSKVHCAGALSGRQRTSLVPWRKRSPVTWS